MKEIRDLIRHLAHDQKKTVLLSSHLLNEVEMVANRMAIINKGELVTQGAVAGLLDEGEKYVIVRGKPAAKLKAVLKRQKLVQKVVSRRDECEVTMSFDDIPALVKNKIEVQALIPRRSLEDLFLSLTESELKL